jgi:hypothetical protein
MSHSERDSIASGMRRIGEIGAVGGLDSEKKRDAPGIDLSSSLGSLLGTSFEETF